MMKMMVNHSSLLMSKVIIHVIQKIIHLQYQVLVGKDPVDVVDGNKLFTLPTWGPTFSFSLDILLTLNDTQGRNRGIIRFENYPANYGQPGSHIPSLAHRSGGLKVGMYYGDLWSHTVNYHVPINQWFNVFMTLDTSGDGGDYLEMRCDDVTVLHHNLSSPAQTYENVNVWANYPYATAEGAQIKNFYIYPEK